MPRILRITPEMAGVPAAAPLARQGDTPSPWPAIAQAAGSLARTTQQVGGELVRIQGALQAEDAKLDMQERFNQLKYDFANRELEIREGIEVPQPGPTTASDMNGGVGQPSPLAAGPDLFTGLGEPAPALGAGAGPAGMLSNLPALIQPAPQPTARPLQPKDYAQIYSKELDKMVEDSVKGLKYPGYERQYRAALAPFVGAQKIEALNRGIKLQHATMLIKDDLAAREEEQTAVTGGTPELRQGAFSSRVDRIARFVESGLMSPEQGKAALQSFRHNVDKGSAIRDFNSANPEVTLQTQHKLLAGTWASSMTYAEQVGLARDLQAQVTADAARREKQEEKVFKDRQRHAMVLMSNKATDKDTTLKEIRDFAVEWQLTPGEKEHLEKMYSAPPVEAPSNTAVLADAVSRAYRYAPTISEAQLRKLYDPTGGTGLNTTDFKMLSSQVTQRVQHNTEYGHTLTMQQYAQGEQELMIGLGVVPSMINNLTQESKQALSLAMRDYSQRAFPLGGQAKEDPFTVKNELIVKYRGAITTIGLEPKAIRNTLVYPVRGIDMDSNPHGVIAATSDALEQALRDGRINRDGYRAERDKIEQMKEGVKARDKRDAARGGAPPESSGGAKPKNPVGTPKYTPGAKNVQD